MHSLSLRKDQLTKTLGRLEAEKAYLEKELGREDEKKSVTISYDDFNNAHSTISSSFKEVSHAISVDDLLQTKIEVDTHSKNVETFFTTHSTKKISDQNHRATHRCHVEIP